MIITCILVRGKHMNILESLRKIENKIYREQDESIDLQGMYLKEDVDK